MSLESPVWVVGEEANPAHPGDFALEKTSSLRAPIFQAVILEETAREPVPPLEIARILWRTSEMVSSVVEVPAVNPTKRNP